MVSVTKTRRSRGATGITSNPANYGVSATRWIITGLDQAITGGSWGLQVVGISKVQATKAELRFNVHATFSPLKHYESVRVCGMARGWLSVDFAADRSASYFKPTCDRLEYLTDILVTWLTVYNAPPPTKNINYAYSATARAAFAPRN